MPLLLFPQPFSFLPSILCGASFPFTSEEIESPPTLTITLPPSLTLSLSCFAPPNVLNMHLQLLHQTSPWYLVSTLPWGNGHSEGMGLLEGSEPRFPSITMLFLSHTGSCVRHIRRTDWKRGGSTSGRPWTPNSVAHSMGQRSGAQPGVRGEFRSHLISFQLWDSEQVV